MQESSPYRPPSNESLATEIPKRSYGGIGRVMFISLSVANLLFCFALGLAFVESRLLFVPFSIYYLFQSLISLPRLQNLGYRGAWVFATFVPILGLLVWIRCLVASEGYAHHRQLDAAGIFFLTFFIVLLALLAMAQSRLLHVVAASGACESAYPIRNSLLLASADQRETL